MAEETLRQAGVDLFLETEVLALEKTKKGWRVGPVEGRQVVDATGSATVAALAGAERVQASCMGMGHLVPQQDHRTSQTIHRENGAIHRLKS